MSIYCKTLISLISPCWSSLGATYILLTCTPISSNQPETTICNTSRKTTENANTLYIKGGAEGT